MADQVKVYELAKTLGVRSALLMQKIRREWKLPVKSHMESLSPDLVREIEKKFSAGEKKSPAAKSRGKSPAKKIGKTTRKASGKKPLAAKDKPPKTGPDPVLSKTAAPSPPAPVRQIIRRRKEEQAQPSAFSSSAVSPPQKDGGLKPSPVVSEEIQKAPPGGIRSDLVSVRSAGPLDDSQWTVPADPARKPPRRPLAEKEVEVKFHAADFRKREVIFQPKKKRVVTSGDVKKTQITTPKSHKRVIKVYGEISLEDLAGRLGIKKKALIHKLNSQGVDTKGRENLDFETTALIVSEWGFEAKNIQKTDKELFEEVSSIIRLPEASVQSKPPVVTVMGHVDHGKTTLLDAIRRTRVAQGEAGGITQHIGAYSVSADGRPITFIDTPGHSAFTAMRARGAQATDIVVIVVSAVDGVMPQTMEAVSHAKTAGTPVIVAVNKMDVEGASLDRVKQELSKQNIVPEDWGGDTGFIPISALKGEGIKDLLERIHLVAEVQELECNPEEAARGMVIEASLEKGRGPVVTLLIQDGTLKIGQNILAGRFMGRVRQMKNDQGRSLKETAPGFPVEVVGLPSLPEVGDLFCAVKDEKAARELIKTREFQQARGDGSELSVEDLLEKTHGAKDSELKVILKADVSGSLEALKKALEPIKGEGVSLQIIHSGTGGITESDVLLAGAVSGTVLGFNVRPDGKAARTAQDKNVEIRSYSVIYELLDDVRKMMIGLLAPVTEEEEQGFVEVREIFHISKVGTVAGCYVTRGLVTRNSLIRVVRDGRLAHSGKISSLKRFKEDVREVKSGFECGLSLENFNDIKPKDVLEAYIEKEVRRTEL